VVKGGEAEKDGTAGKGKGKGVVGKDGRAETENGKGVARKG